MGFIKFLFGTGDSERAQRDQWRPSVVGKNLISPVNDYGTCFGCDGKGERTLDCNTCDGSGQFSGSCHSCDGTGLHTRPAKVCFRCSGSGTSHDGPCVRCDGTGEFRPAISETCRRCEGTGRFSARCKRCEGAGERTVTCRKCGGSGWHKFQ